MKDKPETNSSAEVILKKEAYKTFGQLPISFELNQGQTDSQVRYLSKGKGYSLFLTPKEAVLTLTENSTKKIKARKTDSYALNQSSVAKKRDVIRMKFVNGNPQTKITGQNEIEGKSHYFIGNDTSAWQRNIPHFKEVKYENLYQGVDLIYYGNQDKLEYDFIVAPNHSPNVIDIKFEGASNLKLDEEGNLVIKTRNGEIIQNRPVIYQFVEGQKKFVDGEFLIKGKTSIGFSVGSYDSKLPLVIDPVISFTTYLGGSFQEDGNDIAVDTAGNAYIVGTTYSANFPTSAPLDNTISGGNDVFVTKISPTGRELVFSTYFGGSNLEVGNSIALDLTGNVYLTGATSSTNFPIVNPLQGTFGGTPDDVFVTKLDQTGSTILYSTYLGGAPVSGVGGSDQGNSIAVDYSGNVYLTGYTSSNNFPNPNAAQPVKASRTDAFVSKINSNGTGLVFSTFLGGTNNSEAGWAVATDATGNTYVGGITGSTDFPTLSAFQGANAGDLDGFITMYNPGGARVFSTYFGGTSTDYIFELALDFSGNIFVGGTTKSSSTFPRVNARQNTFGGGLYDGFISKLNAAGNALVFSTFHGGSGDTDTVYGLAVDGPGNVYVTGETSSSNFPLEAPFQSVRNGTLDAFITKLNASGTSLSYSTYQGGSSTDGGTSVALSNCGEPYVIGSTFSSNYPTTSDAVQTSHGGDKDGFITKIEDNKLAGIAPDATVPGINGVGVGFYELPASIDPEIMADRQTQIRAQIYYPTTLGDVRPLLIFLHGNHSTCGEAKKKTTPRIDYDSRFTIDGGCSPSLTQVEAPSDKGYEYLARELAKEGYFVVSINANLGITGAADLDLLPDDPFYIQARGKLVLKHLQRLYEWNANGTPLAVTGTIGTNLRNRLDFSNVGLMGHSRGGEGVRAAFNIYKNSPTVAVPEAALLEEIILDNTSPSGVTVTGAWSAASTDRGYYGTNYLTDDNTGQGTKSVTFQPGVPAAGTYKLYYRWSRVPANPGMPQPRATNIPMEITTAGGVVNYTLNQYWDRRNVWAWKYIGDYNFNAGSSGSIKISNTGTNNVVIADAVRLVPSVTPPSTPWQNRIKDLNIRAIFEIGPTDFSGYNAEGTAWNALLPMCDGDVSDLQGVKVFDRAMVDSTTSSADVTQKSTYTVWGTNHNFFNTEWQYDDGGRTLPKCFGKGNVALFGNTVTPPNFANSLKQRQTAIASLKAFFMANVGVSADANFNKNFNPRYDVPPAVKGITRVERGFAFTPVGSTSEVIIIDDFHKAGPSGINGAGPGNTSSGINMNYGNLPARVPLHDTSLQAGRISWDAPNNNNYFQTNLASPIDITSFGTLDFRISRANNSALNLTDSTNLSIQLVKNDGTLSEPVELCKYLTVVGPVGGFNAGANPMLPDIKPILQTARIPLADFSVDLSQIKGVRFTFNITPKGDIHIANVRTSR